MTSLRLLVMGDFHESNDIPKSRIDDFHATKKQLIQEINDIAKSHQCRAILQMGDFLNKNVLPHAVLMDIVKRWKPHAPAQQLQKLQNGEISVEAFLEALKEDIPMIGVVGNHELIGNSLNTLPKTSIYLLKEMGFMQLVDRQNPVIFKDEETGQTVAITGTHYHKNMDMPGYESDYIVDEKLGDIHIHLVHGYGEVKATPWPHTLVSQFIDQTKADVTICGHDHNASPLVKSGNHLFFNPGSPQKIKADEIGKKPQVALLDITSDGVEVQFIPLVAGSNTEEIISRERIEEKKLQEQKLAEIKSAVTKASLEERLTIVDIAKGISDNQNFPIPIKDDVVHRLEEMMSNLTKEYRSTRPYYVARMVIKNFQSHKDTTIEFDPGLNVFIGESGEGKSALQRAFWFVFDKAKINPKNFIHKGEKECSVTLELSDETTITRFVTSSGKNGYKIYDAQTGQTHEGNTTLVSLAQELLGYSPLVLDEKTTMPLNFMKQGEGWYFIGSQVTGPMRAKVIGSFYQTHYADAVMKDLENESKKTTAELKLITSKVEELDEKLIAFNYLDALEERLTKVNEEQSQLEELITRYQKLKTLYLKYYELGVWIERHETALSTLIPALEQARLQEKELKEKIQRFQQLKQLRDQLHLTASQLSYLEEKVTDFISIPDLYQSLTYLQQKTQRFQQLKQLRDQQVFLTEAIRYYDHVLAERVQTQPLYAELTQLKSLSNQFYQQYKLLQFVTQRLAQYRALESMITEIEAKWARLPNLNDVHVAFQQLKFQQENYLKLSQLYEKQQELVQLGTQEVQQLTYYQQLLTQEVASYRQLLEQLKQCPVCLAEISADTINHIIAKHVNHSLK